MGILRDLLDEALADQAKFNAERDVKDGAERAKLADEVFTNIFGIDPDATYDNGEILADGVRFRVFDRSRLAVVGKCRLCSATITSPECAERATLAGYVKEFKEGWPAHDCPKAKPGPPACAFGDRECNSRCPVWYAAPRGASSACSIKAIAQRLNEIGNMYGAS